MEAQLDKRVETALNVAGVEYKVMACDPDFADTAAFCEKYGYRPDQSANTILVAGKGDPTVFAACVVLATTRLDVNKKVCQELEIKRASFANAEQTVQLTGMMVGGVTAFGLLPEIPILVDASVLKQPEIVMGGGNRSSKVLLDTQELHKLPNLRVVNHLALARE